MHRSGRRFERLEEAGEGRALEGVWRALVLDRTELFELGVQHVEAVHRHVGRDARLGGVDQLGQLHRERRLADAGATGETDRHPAGMRGEQRTGPLGEIGEHRLGGEGQDLLVVVVHGRPPIGGVYYRILGRGEMRAKSGVNAHR